MATVIKPPAKLIRTSTFSIFLAGSIEMGTAEDWQTEITNKLSNRNRLVIYNPRCDDWNSSWEQDISNPQFKEQVNCELDALAICDLIVMYFDPATKSPITLLEFGKYYDSGKIVVASPKGFWKLGNLQVCCERAGIKLLNSKEDLINVTMTTLDILGVK